MSFLIKELLYFILLIPTYFFILWSYKKLNLSPQKYKEPLGFVIFVICIYLVRFGFMLLERLF